ncbi:MAG: hypothetical protein N2167_10160 [Flavobacteriales bacterium]|nr:hypothetical protein [Flavobacteriales bacterium]
MQTLTDLIKLIPTESPLQKLQDTLYEKHNMTLYMKRDDLLHQQWGGNKARKLYGHVQEFVKGNYDGWFTWGGPWSNHLHAFAAFSNYANIPFQVFIRGNNFAYRTPLFDFIEACGGKIYYLSREEYMLFKSSSNELLPIPENWYAVPEGGGGEPGKVGCRILAEEILRDVIPHRICLAIGTQTTLKGIADVVSCNISGFSALKGLYFKNEKIEITDEFSLGGYAKASTELFQFILEFYKNHQILLDPVYTGKMMWGIHQQIARGEWDGESVVVIHSGGLQGIHGYPELLKQLWAFKAKELELIYKIYSY